MTENSWNAHWNNIIALSTQKRQFELNICSLFQLFSIRLKASILEHITACKTLIFRTNLLIMSHFLMCSTWNFEEFDPMNQFECFEWKIRGYPLAATSFLRKCVWFSFRFWRRGRWYVIWVWWKSFSSFQLESNWLYEISLSTSCVAAYWKSIFIIWTHTYTCPSRPHHFNKIWRSFAMAHRILNWIWIFINRISLFEIPSLTFIIWIGCNWAYVMTKNHLFKFNRLFLGCNAWKKTWELEQTRDGGF